MKDTIISNYNGEDHKKYKSLWKHAYRTIAKNLVLSVGTINREDDWD